jgi:hypothetical protein
VEQVQSGAGGKGGGHATGGALSMLYHQRLGPILTASMTEYQMVELSNQQTHRGKPFMTLTPRIEGVGAEVYTSLNDLRANLSVSGSTDKVEFNVNGRLENVAHASPAGGDVRYRLTYGIGKDKVEIGARVEADGATAPLNFILPVISRDGEVVEVLDAATVRITKPGGRLTIRTDAPAGFGIVPKVRTFNLVPGFECLPLTIAMKPGSAIRIQLEAS